MAARMTTAAALAELKELPQLPDHIADLQAAFEAEQRRREQFIEEIDEVAKAEFINGERVIHSPSRLAHSKVVLRGGTLLSQYADRHGLGVVLVEKTLIRCRRNDYEPDICFFRADKTTEWKDDLKIFPPPDLIVEVLSPSTERNDRTIKFQDYAAHGVSEYWIIDADEQVIEQYILPPGTTAYTLHARVDADARLISPTVRGFNVSAAALFDAEANQRALLTLLQNA